MARSRDASESEELLMPNPLTPLPELTDAERACNVGDVLCLIHPVQLNGSWDDPTPSTLEPSGQTYRAVSLFSRGWDLEKVSGTGPDEIRIMNWDVRRYFDIVQGAAKMPRVARG